MATPEKPTTIIEFAETASRIDEPPVGYQADGFPEKTYVDPDTSQTRIGIKIVADWLHWLFRESFRALRWLSFATKQADVILGTQTQVSQDQATIWFDSSLATPIFKDKAGAQYTLATGQKIKVVGFDALQSSKTVTFPAGIEIFMDSPSIAIDLNGQICTFAGSIKGDIAFTNGGTVNLNGLTEAFKITGGTGLTITRGSAYKGSYFVDGVIYSGNQDLQALVQTDTLVDLQPNITNYPNENRYTYWDNATQALKRRDGTTVNPADGTKLHILNLDTLSAVFDLAVYDNLKITSDITIDNSTYNLAFGDGCHLDLKVTNTSNVSYGAGCYGFLNGNSIGNITAVDSLWRQGIVNALGEIQQRGDFTLVNGTYGYAGDVMAGMASGTAVTSGIFTTVNDTSLLGSFGYAFKFENVTITGTGELYQRYRMDAKDAQKWKGQSVSIGVKVYHDVLTAINYTIAVRKADSSNNFTTTTDIGNSGQVSVDSGSEKQISFINLALGDCSNGIEIEVKIECGAIANKNFYLTEFAMNLGTILLPCQPKSFREELADCQRFMCKSYDIDVAPGTPNIWQGEYIGYANPSGHFRIPVRFPTKMSAHPVVAIYSPITGATGVYVDQANNDCTATVIYIGESGFGATSNAATNPNYAVHLQYTAIYEL